MRRVKILATLGPSVDDEDVLRRLLKKVDGVRLNFSHGDKKEHLERIKRVRELEEELDKIITVVGDTKGPEVRTGEVEFNVEKGKAYELSLFDFKPSNVFEETVEEGDVVLMDDGKVTFMFEGGKLRALNDYKITPKRGVVIRGKDFPLPSITKEDLEYVDFMKRYVDVVAQSFVKTSEDVEEMKRLTGKFVIAKIETNASVRRLDSIAAVSDGMMAARGDLALVVREEEVPFIQLDIVKKSLDNRKLSIVATQMLESMVNNPFPTRAEISDVFYAVLKGADCLMLSGETAKGKYPLESVEVMERIIMKAQSMVEVRTAVRDYKDMIASTALTLSEEVGKPVIAPTMHGTTPRKLSAFRPKHPIYVVSPKLDTLRFLNLFYGVKVKKADYEPVFDKFDVIKKLFSINNAVFVFGYPPGNHMTNTIIIK